MASAPILILGDSFDELKKLAANSANSFVTDPPYGIRFMGKAWDGKDIAAKASNRMNYSTDPDPKTGERGGRRSVAAEAGKYDRSANANAAFQQWTHAWAIEAFRILKPGGYLVSFASTRTYHRMTCGIEDAGFEIRDQIGWAFGSGFPKSLNLPGGLGTALKPGWEPICLARKPLIGTVAANVAAHGTGCLNIDACRIPLAEDDVLQDGITASAGHLDTAEMGFGFKRVDREAGLGRWPANLLHDGSDEVVVMFPQSDGAAAPVKGTEPTANGFSGPVLYGGFKGRVCQTETFRGDSDSAARFFFNAKTSTTERDAGLEDFAAVRRSDGRAKDIENPRLRTTSRANHHPTVKPIALMRWLVRLVTPVGGTAIDPFMGSGTTGIACVCEDRGFIGIEREPEYMEIARARIAHAQGPLFATTK